MLEVELDFETVSTCDLKACGAERYAEDLSTDVICLLFFYSDLWWEWCPGCIDVANDLLHDLAYNPEVYFVAHNAAFEQAIWRHKMVAFYGFPEIPIPRWRCTMAAAAHKGMRLALDKLSRDLRLSQAKDMDGNRLTLGLSKLETKKDHMARKPEGFTQKAWRAMYVPQLPVITPAIRRRVMDYCRQDVVVENEVKERVGLLGKAEQKVWELDQTINRRGVRLDMKFVEAAQAVVDKASAPLRDEFTRLTGIAKVGSQSLLGWCLENGTQLDNLQKQTLAKLLDLEEDDGSPDAGYESLAGEMELDSMQEMAGMVSPTVRRVLEIRQMLGGAAIKKLKRMQACVGEDGRARGLLQYHAAHSGRWGGRLLQPQNFPRDSLKVNPEQAVQVIMSGDPEVVERELGLPALEAVARSLRHALVPAEGKMFLVGDYAQIEARTVLALAGQHDKTAMMAAGQNPYLDFGAIMFGRPISKNNNYEYIPSKAGVLGCGFQCGPINFNIKFLGGTDLNTAELVVETYREEWAPKVPSLWYGLDRASLRAVENAKPYQAYGVTYEPRGDWLMVRTPCPWSRMWYYGPRLDRSRFDQPCWTSMQSKQGNWEKIDMYGGLETENVVQHLARCLMVEAMFRVERAGMPVVLTCHDEIVCEVDESLTDETKFANLMAQSTPWIDALGIPIAVETWTGTRYKK